MNPKRIEITPPDPCSSSPVPYAHLLTEAPINLTTLICSPYLTSLISEHDAEQQTHTHTSISSKQLIILSQLLRSSNAVPQRRPRTSLLLSFGVPNKSRRRRRRRRKDSREENKRKGEEKRERNSHKWGRGSAVQIHPSESTYKNKQKNTGERERKKLGEREKGVVVVEGRERGRKILERGSGGGGRGGGPPPQVLLFQPPGFVVSSVLSSSSSSLLPPTSSPFFPPLSLFVAFSVPNTTARARGGGLGSLASSALCPSLSLAASCLAHSRLVGWIWGRRRWGGVGWLLRRRWW